MNIWYDVMDIVSWSLPHLTGIQRTTVGILRGLLERGVDVQLVSYDAGKRIFTQCNIATLPPAVLAGLPLQASIHPGWNTQSEAGKSVENQSGTARKHSQTAQGHSRSIGNKIFGDSPAAKDLRLSFRQFQHATRQLAASFLNIYRLPTHKPESLGLSKTPHLFGPLTPPPSAFDSETMFRCDDILLCCGATWTLSHAAATAALRQQGVRVIRMIYDLIPTLKPQWVSQSLRQEIIPWVRKILTNSDQVLTISEFSKKATL